MTCHCLCHGPGIVVWHAAEPCCPDVRRPEPIAPSDDALA